MPVLWFDEMPGGWTYFKEEAVRLARLGHEIIVLCPHPGKQWGGKEPIKVYRYKSYWLTGRAFVINPFSFILCIVRLFKELKDIDIIYDDTSGLYPLGFLLKVWLVLRRTKLPIVCHIHGELKDLSNRGLLSVAFELYLNIIARVEYMVADSILLSGDKIRPRAISLGADSRKLKVVPYGLKYEIAPITPNVPNGLRFTVGFVGRPTRAKGLDSILKGFALARIPESTLMIVGDGQETTLMKNLANSLGVLSQTRFLGYRNDVPFLMGEMDVFANLTLSEGGISGSQMEAMLAGLPSVISPFSDYLTDGKGVIIVNNPQEFAKALRLLHSDVALRTKMGKDALERGREIVKVYSWGTYLEKVQQVFTEVTA